MVTKSDKVKAYKDFLETPSGKIILKDLSDFCGHQEDAHMPGDSHDTAYRLGRQRVIRRIQGFLNITDQELTRVIEVEKEPDIIRETYDIFATKI